MNVHVSRDGKPYGPYEIEDLKSYVAQGSILPTDAAWTEGMASWATVADVLARAGHPVAAPTPAAAAPAYAPQPAAPAWGAAPAAAPGGTGDWPDPPEMQWPLVLVLSIVTCGIFAIFWMFKQAGYAKKLDAASQGITLYTAYLACAVAALVLSFLVGGFLPRLVNLVGLVVAIVAAFNLRSTFERHFNTNENVGLRLHPVMTFFFSILYFQYHLSRIANWRRTGVLG